MSDSLRGRCVWLVVPDDPKGDARPAIVLAERDDSEMVVAVVGFGNIHRDQDKVVVEASSRFARQWKGGGGNGLTKDTAFCLDNIALVDRSLIRQICFPIGPLFMAKFEVLYVAWLAASSRDR